MNEYKLTLTVKIKGQDDPDARKRANEISETIAKVVPDAKIKLQQVYEDKAPRGVRLG